MSSRPNADHGTPLHANGTTSNERDNGMPTKQDSRPDDQFQHPMTLDEVHIKTFYAQMSHEPRINIYAELLQFRKRAHETVDYICDYYARVDDMPVRAAVEVLYTPCRHVLTAICAHAKNSSCLDFAVHSCMVTKESPVTCCSTVYSLATYMLSFQQKHHSKGRHGKTSWQMLTIASCQVLAFLLPAQSVHKAVSLYVITVATALYMTMQLSYTATALFPHSATTFVLISCYEVLQQAETQIRLDWLCTVLR